MSPKEVHLNIFQVYRIFFIDNFEKIKMCVKYWAKQVLV